MSVTEAQMVSPQQTKAVPKEATRAAEPEAPATTLCVITTSQEGHSRPSADEQCASHAIRTRVTQPRRRGGGEKGGSGKWLEFWVTEASESDLGGTSCLL